MFGQNNEWEIRRKPYRKNSTNRRSDGEQTNNSSSFLCPPLSNAGGISYSCLYPPHLHIPNHVFTYTKRSHIFLLITSNQSFFDLPLSRFSPTLTSSVSLRLSRLYFFSLHVQTISICSLSYSRLE